MTPSPFRNRLLIGASATALVLAAGSADAQSMFRKTPSNPAMQAAAAAAQRATQNQAASTATQRTIAAFTRASAIRQRMDAAQAAARAAAMAAASNVPNGLGKGGLQAANGVATDPSLWIGANGPTQASGSDGRTKVEVGQTEAKAILTWDSFNVGRETDLTFNQHGNTDWVALNRVTDASASPSKILGSIKADGTVLILNRNGVIFGGSAQVNVGSLVASSLAISDKQFLKGIVNAQALDPTTNASFAPIFANESGVPAGDVIVEAGAQIMTPAPKSVTIGGGFVYLFGQNVTNGGAISTPNGQAVLAAGRAVYVTQSIDPNVRGVELNLEDGGRVTNLANALVAAPTGNVTLIGKAVEQQGVALASTSIDEAGSISLTAYDGIRLQYAGSRLGVVPVTGGTVTIGADSLTAVLPQDDGRTALNGQPQGQSQIRAEGLTVEVAGGATLLAPSGRVALQAAGDAVNLYMLDHPTLGLSGNNTPDAARVYVGDGALIDVAGLQNIAAAASEDVVQVSVRSNELRDSPLQRGGVLQNSNVYVNVHDIDRVAGDQIYTAGGLLEISGFLGLVPHTLDQRLTTGGAVAISSTGDAILRPGATIDIAGGSIAHQAGFVNQTLLVDADGRIYTANNAPADLKYVQVGAQFTVDHSRWGVIETWQRPFARQAIFQAAYLEGKDAGSLSVNANSAEIDAHVEASALNGLYQRSAGTMAHGGAFSASGVPSVSITSTTTVPPDSFAPGGVVDGPRDPATLLPDRDVLHLSADALTAAGYGSIRIASTNSLIGSTPGGAALPGIALSGGATLQVTPGGSIALVSSTGITIDGALVARGGSVSVNATNPQASQADVAISSRSRIDTSGTWTNDIVTPSIDAPLLYDGGSISVDSIGGITLAKGALLDASGGGWLQSDGTLKSDSHGLALGAGGDITIITNEGLHDSLGDPTVYPNSLVLQGTIRSNGLHGGGRLTLGAPSIQIGGSELVDATTLRIDPAFLASSGFGSYRLLSYGALTVASDVALSTQVLQPTSALQTLATGGRVEEVTTLGAPLLYQQAAPVNLVLSANDVFAGDLVLAAGAEISTDPGASVSLHASHQLTVNGAITAPGGTINLDLYGLRNDVGVFGYPTPSFDPAQTLWIGDTARLSATGLIQNFTDASRAPAYRIWNGGTIAINRHGDNPDYYPIANFFGAGNPQNSLIGGPLAPLGAVVGRAGSVIDVSGASGFVTTVASSGVSRRDLSVPVSTRGGTLDILASQGLLFDTSVDAHGGGAAIGGRLAIDQTLWTAAPGATDYQRPIGELIITQRERAVPDGLALGMAVPADFQGQMRISADQIMDAGFDDVSLGAVNAAVFQGDVSLHAGRSLTLSAPALSATPGAAVALGASYIDIGAGRRNLSNDYGGTQPDELAQLSAGDATLRLDADLIDLEAGFSSGVDLVYSPVPYQATAEVTLPGFASIDFNSRGDIRLAPSSSNPAPLRTLGDITFTSAQIYPITSPPTSGTVSTPYGYGQIQIAATGPDSVIAIAGNGAAVPAVPYSAGGQVQFVAPTIEQGGVLRAPMGQITFGDSSIDPVADPDNPRLLKTIDFLPGSITSVSTGGLVIPYGGVVGDQQYTYGFPTTIALPTQKIISIYGRSVNFAGAADGKAAARIDEAGGGDLSAYQFVSGTGGSVDTLNGAETFAILPSLGAAYAPRSPLFDTSDQNDANAAPVDLQVGDQVYLDGVAGLQPGYYTLLPGHYALLPGGYKLTVSATDVPPSRAQYDSVLPTGAYRVTGYRSVLNTSFRDSLASEFVVTPGSVVRQQSQYVETTISKFFQAQADKAGATAPLLPADAGQLVLDAFNSLSFKGVGDFTVAKGGRGGRADLVGTQLAVLGQSDIAPDGYVGISDDFITAIGAQSVLLGGVRTISRDGLTLQISNEASDVEIGAHAVLAAPEILVRASGSITLDPGAVIDTSGAGAIANVFPVDSATGQSLGSIRLDGGAFLIASNATAPIPVVLTGAGDGSSLAIGAGARIESKGSLALANTSDFTLADTAVIAAPTLSIAAPIINLGGHGSDGIDLTNALLATLMRGDAEHGIAPTTTLALSAGDAIGVYGSTSFGLGDATTPTLARLTIKTPVIRSFVSDGGTATLGAKELVLEGATAAAPAGMTGGGALVLDAVDLMLGGGNLGFDGFATVSLDASARITGSGKGHYTATGDLVVSTPLMTGAANADTTFDVAGDATFRLPNGSAADPADPIQSIGAHLTVNAASILQDAAIMLPSGVVTLNGKSGVTLGAHSVTDVSGATTRFYDVARIAPGGTVSLAAQSGDVTITQGAMVDLSGGDLADLKTGGVLDPLSSDRGGDAGSLLVAAPNGTASLGGTIATTTLAGYRGGQATIAVNSGDAAALLDAIAGFSGKQALALRTGDITVRDITARDVELSTADSLTVLGTIDASGADGGTIRLGAGKSLTVAEGALLDAHATASNGDAGSVFLGINGAGDGRLTLARGATIDLSGNGPNGGRLWLRAPRIGMDAMALSADGAIVRGAREIDAEAVAVIDISGTPYVDQHLADATETASRYMANAGAITAGIGSLGASPLFHLMPGIELDSAGDMTLLTAPSSTNTGIDLHGYRYGGEGMALTLRAAGTLTMNGSLSDGFEAPVASPDGNVFALAALLPRGSRSATMRLAAGADLAAGDPTVVLAASAVAPGSGKLLFNDPHNDAAGNPVTSVLRTGTGDLEIAAAGDIDFQTAFGVYTAGTPSAAVAGFTVPVRELISSGTDFAEFFFPSDSYLGYDFTTFARYDDEGYPLDFHPSYPEHGGDVRVSAGGDVTSVATADGNHAASENTAYWLRTTGRFSPSGTGSLIDGTSFINFGSYYQNYSNFDTNYTIGFYGYDSAPGIAAYRGIGALGGGAVDVIVGGNLANVDIATPVTQRTPAGATSVAQVVTTGGGDLSLVVGGAMDGATIDVGRGTAYVRAASIGTTQRVDLEVGDAQLTAISDGELQTTIGDPTRALAQSGITTFGAAPPGLYSRDPMSTVGVFTSHTGATQFHVRALGGDVALLADFAPPVVDIVADAGSISGASFATFEMLPTETAQLDLLAGRDIVGVGVSMTGMGPIKSTEAAGYLYAGSILTLGRGSVSSTVPLTLLQPDDPRTVHVYAKDGDLQSVSLVTSKRAAIRAGEDIVVPTFEIQNNRASDVSLVTAGRDMVSCPALDQCNGFNIRIAGPGTLEVEAGRDILIQALQTAYFVPTQAVGISSIGNADNALLPAKGASINVGVGVKDYAIPAFIATYFDPANSAGVLQSYADVLLAYMRDREGNAALGIDQALVDFRALSPAEQLPLVEKAYFAELKAGGRAVADGQGTGGKGYNRAYKAITTLFPGSTPGTRNTVYDGSLTITQLGSLRTLSGGDINVLVPGGDVTLGIENQVPDLTGQADTARPGILTLRGGDVNLFTDGDVIVAQSRVFTELGGDILMFSDSGDLNAGKGKQTSIVTSPAQFTVSPYGQVTKSPVTPQTGAGIATLIGVPGVEPGDVDLFAPNGTIDAGDAGIRVSGDLHIAALQIVNAQNIQVQGASVGLPPVVAVNTAALTAASAATGAVANEAERLAERTRPKPQTEVPTILNVRFLGFGES